ncbi:MAG TPA: carboxypeptidase regulatory-like domain-containing protein [Terriglobales bacterium]|nr:carboxypeptidase regulatory-like domain-containing protein [Terriglobales bacterium]
MRKVIVAILALLVLLCASQLVAQTVTGTLSGRVVDASGAVIPNATVTAKGEQTGLVRETATNAEGFYVFNLMPLGTYEVTAKSSGFSAIKKTGVKIELNVTTNSEFKLQPASTSVEVSVVGEVPLIETATGEVKGTIDSKLIQDRPLAGRNFRDLVTTIAGFQVNQTSGQNNATLSTGSSVSFNGTGSRGATFQIDGVNNDDSSENQNRQGVNLSTIQEVQVLSNAFSAEFGRGYGAVVLVQTKQGTNRLHGDAFWFHNNSKTSTRSYYLPTTYKFPPSRKHDFGGTVGGPIIKDKLFFFGSFEGIRSGGSSTWRRDIMLPSDKVIIDDPSNPVPMTAADKAWIQSVMDRYPNVAPNDPVNGPRSYITSINAHYPQEDYTGRMDWNINSRNSLTGRYQFTNNRNWSDDVIKGENPESKYRQQNLGLTFTHVYNNFQTGEFRLGVGRRESRVGLVGGNDTPVLRFTNGGAQRTAGGTIMGNAAAYPIERFQTDWQFVYNHYWQVSPKVTFKFGTDVRPGQLNDLAATNIRGTRYVTDNNLDCPNTKYPNPPAACYHDAYWFFQRGMWGSSGSYSRGYGASSLANNLNEYNFYLQSDIRLTPSFTLNLGLRDEYVLATKERSNRVDYGYGNTNHIAPRIGFAYSPQASEGFWAKITGGPGKSSIRGGFALAAGRLFQSYFSQDGASVRFSPPNGAVPAFDVKQNQYKHFADPTNGYVFTPGVWPESRVSITQVDPDLSLPYTEQWNLTLSRELPAQMGLSVAYVGNRGIGLPFYNALNRAQFPFVAPSADKFFASDPNRVWAGISFDHVCAAGEATPTAPVAGQTSQCINAANPYTNARRPDPRYGAIMLIRNGSWSYYNGLQVTLNKRTTHGLAVQSTYTFSKAIDTGSEATNSGLDANFPLTNNPRDMRGLAMTDTTHRFAVTYSYELPWFKNERVQFLEDHGASRTFAAIMGKVLGGWQISGTTTATSGVPFTVVSGVDLNADGIGGDRPNILDPSYLGTTISDGHWQPNYSTTYSQLEMPLSIFQNVYNPGPANIGNLGRNTFRADGLVNFDAALSKNFRIAEGQKLMFRWEVYNVMNHVQFGIPGRTVNSPSSFMKISGQQNGSRSMQFAFRYIF